MTELSSSPPAQLGASGIPILSLGEALGSATVHGLQLQSL